MPLTPQTEHRIVYSLLAGALIILLGSTVYLFSVTREQRTDLKNLTEERNELLKEKVSITDSLLEERELASSTISELSERLSLTAEELEDIERDLRREKDRNEEFEDQISELAGTVGVLDKLSKTDKELLQKYSRTYFLNENFIPMKLSLIPDEYLMNQGREMYFHGDALKYLEDMLDAAERSGHDIKIVSAFRSFDEQREVKNGHAIIYGSGANAFSADQGYSEHQLGTTVDIVDIDTYNLVQSFGTTEAFAWLEKNAYKYGFILSYPEGNQFYIYEPWHWRFVGRELARDLHDDGRSFYDLDQRELDKYLVSIFD
jgi:LAS superfamily LD-carboxypeptidase LdcB